MPHRDKPASFLDLPIEIRWQIYDLAVPHVRIHNQTIDEDTEWTVHNSSPTRLSFTRLPLACKQIYSETIALVYSRATLAIKPPASSSPSEEQQTDEQFSKQFGSAFEHCPRHLLRHVKTVHVYNGQKHICAPKAFQAMFRWLVENTGVSDVWFSRKMVQQWRYQDWIALDGCQWVECEGEEGGRTIDVYSGRISRLFSSASCSFGLMKCDERKKLGKFVYVADSIDGLTGLRLVSRYEDDIMATEEEKMARNRLERARFAGKDMGDEFMKEAHGQGRLGLLQVIQIQPAMTLTYVQSLNGK